MTDKGAFYHLRNIGTVLSLINVLSVFGQKTVEGGAALGHILADPTVRTRLWISAGLFAVLGLASFVFLVVKTRDTLLDFDEKAARAKKLALVFGSIEILVAVAIAVVLLSVG